MNPMKISPFKHKKFVQEAVVACCSSGHATDTGYEVLIHEKRCNYSSFSFSSQFINCSSSNY